MITLNNLFLTVDEVRYSISVGQRDSIEAVMRSFLPNVPVPCEKWILTNTVLKAWPVGRMRDAVDLKDEGGVASITAAVDVVVAEKLVEPPPPAPELRPWRVSKDTLLGRIDAAGKTADCMAIIASLTPAEQFLWTNFAWFWSNNERIRGMITGVGLNPDEIMAPDLYA